jgi:hypothetical protein
MRVGATGDWKPVGMPTMFPNATSGLSAPSALHLKTVLKEASDEYWFIAVGVDRAGNVERSSRAANLSAALEEAFNAKRDACGDGADSLVCKHVVVDQTRPTVGALGISGGRVVSREGSEFQYLRGGAPVEFFVCAGDRGGEISRVDLGLDHIDVLNGTVETTILDMTRADQPCADGSARFVNNAWGQTNGNKATTRDGFWSASFDVYDRAANRVQVPVANIVLDSVAPEATPQAPIFPGDQSAVKPGDTVKLRLTATDRFDVDPVIGVDAKKLNRTQARTTRASDGALEATFTVDREDIRNGVEEVVVLVRDLAGNEQAVRFYVPVNFKSFKYVEGSLRVTTSAVSVPSAYSVAVEVAASLRARGIRLASHHDDAGRRTGSPRRLGTAGRAGAELVPRHRPRRDRASPLPSVPQERAARTAGDVPRLVARACEPVALIAVPEIELNILRPLIGFGKKNLSFGVGIKFGANMFDHRMRFRKIFVVGALTLAQIRNRIQPKPVDTRVEPSLHHLNDSSDDPRVIEIKIRLMTEKAMPIVGVGFGVPGPVRFFRVCEYDPGALVFFVCIAPDIPVARARSWWTALGSLEPSVLIGCMIYNEFGNHA